MQTTPWIARVGLMVLLWLALLAHTYVSMLSAPFVMAKAWGTWRLLPGCKLPVGDESCSNGS